MEDQANDLNTLVEGFGMSAFKIEENGDIFAGAHDILVCPVNCQPGVMGAGLARAFAEKFPGLWDLHRDACEDGYLSIGKPYMIGYGNKSVVLFSTKDQWDYPSRPGWVFRGLSALYDILANHDGYRPLSIGMPALGCGLGSLPFRLIGPMIKVWAAGLDERYSVVLYAPRRLK